MMNNKINVLYCGDSIAFTGFEASIYSLLTHTKNVNIFVFTMDYERDENNGWIHVFQGLQDEQKLKLKQMVQYLDGQHSNITFFDTLEEYKTYFLHGVNEDDGHSSPYAPLRLLIDVMLPEITHILYIDCDTIIQSDIRPMYFKYLTLIQQSECAYAAYPNVIEENDSCYDEMVAGVLLFDMNKVKEQKLLEKARYNITHYYYKWYDQSALEAAGKYVKLEQKYNYMKEYEYRQEEPVILHFADALNPKIYFEPEVFYKKYPHLQYIKDGIELLNTINF